MYKIKLTVRRSHIFTTSFISSEDDMSLPGSRTMVMAWIEPLSPPFVYFSSGSFFSFTFPLDEGDGVLELSVFVCSGVCFLLFLGLYLCSSPPLFASVLCCPVLLRLLCLFSGILLCFLSSFSIIWESLLKIIVINWVGWVNFQVRGLTWIY